MYHVLLVDDEVSVLNMLKNIIQWKELGVELLFSAQDGYQALEIMEKHQVDILITDIKMPNMDGVNLIRRVKKLYPDIRCILLTAYAEFSYAKEAIGLGVENYLLKPISKEEVIQTVQKTMDNLYRSRGNGEMLMRENTLRRWAAGSITRESLSDHAVVLGLNIYMPSYCVICFIKKTDDNVSDYLIFVKELLEKSYEAYSFWDEKNRYVFILGGREFNVPALEKFLLECTTAQDAENKIAIAIGKPVNDADSVHCSYHQASDIAEWSDLKSSEVILENECLESFRFNYLIEEVRFLFFEEEERTRQKGYKYLANKLYPSMNGLETDKVLARLIRICMKVLVTEFPLKSELQEKVYSLKWSAEKHMESDAFSEEVVRVLSWIQNVFQNSFNDYSPIVQLAIRYVRKGVMEGKGISIKDFCGKNGINQTYMGYLYKKETGMFFNDYLTACRINRSVMLLRNPCYKIKDIAEMVGFASVSYYVKRFREIKGVSPTKYQLSSEGGGEL